MASAPINAADIDSFLERVDEVEQELKALMQGDAPNLPTAKKSVTSAAPLRQPPAASESIPTASVAEESTRDPNTARWDSERRAREAREERERWWKLAELHFGGSAVEGEGSCATGAPAAPPSQPKGPRVPLAPKDYRKWDAWVPQDPATQAEEDALRRAREAQADAAFEAANAGFVESFKADAARRAAVEADKVVRATRAKERGNAAFKRGDSRAAIAAYHEALLLTPFNVALLNNLALVHLQAARGAQEGVTAAAAATQQQEQLREPSALDCAVEFCARAIRVEPQNVKALFRRATALLLRGELAEAVRDLEAAASADPHDDEVRRLLETTRLDMAEAEKEARASRHTTEVAATGSSTDDSADCDTQPSPDEPAWEQPMAKLLAAFERFAPPSADSKGGAAGAYSDRSAVAGDGGVFSSVLRFLDDDSARVAFRLSGTQVCLANGVVAAAAHLTSKGEASGAGAPPPLTDVAFVGACTALAAAADNPKNRILLASSGVLGACLDVLAFMPAATRGQGSSLGGLDSACAALHIVDACCRGEVGSASLLHARATIARHAFFGPPRARGGGRSVAALVAAAATALAAASPAALRAPGGPVECLELCGGALQSLAAGAGALEAPPSHDRSAPAPLAAAPSEALSAWGDAEADGRAGSGIGLVEALLGAADALLLRAAALPGASGAAMLTGAAMQRCVGALANLAQIPALRAGFAGSAAASSPAPSPGARAGPPPSAGTATTLRIQPLLKLLVAAATAAAGGAAAFEADAWVVVLGSALAALANASLSTPAVTECLCVSGAPRALLGLLAAAPGAGSSEGHRPPAELRARAAALLGRLCASPAALVTLREAPHLRALTAALASAATEEGEDHRGGATPPAVRALLQDSLVRAVAGVTALGDSQGAAATVAGGGGLAATVTVMRDQLASLRLPAGAPGAGRFPGLGNACKLLGALVDAAPGGGAAELLAQGGVDVLVGALKLEGGSSDPQAAAVRKNASVALARAVRDAACMARARELRGIEILMQLQIQG